MCGIAGWVSTKRNLTEQRDIERMTQTLAKRGPDSWGYYTKTQVALGHRRLAVIDPAGGVQPMTIRKGQMTWTIVYNGELYNTQELRRELQGLGHKLTTHSDTEVLLTSVIQWGKDAVLRLNGIFAFAVWNQHDRTLFAARDPLGVKPLFYSNLQGDLLFASEIKALLAHPGIEPIVAERGLLELFGLGPARSPDFGIFRNIQELPPGHSLYWDDGHLELKQYWQLEAAPHTDDLDTTIERVRSLLIDSIKRQLVADVPLGTFLSGGLDSSAISAVAAQELPGLRTWSLDYQDNQRWFKGNSFQPDPDSNWIDMMTRHIGSNHHDILIKPEQLAGALEDAVRANDLPGMADIDSSLYLFSKAVRQQATVALSGECADEIFGGYPWYWRPELQGSNFPWSNALGLRRSLLSKDLTSLPLEDYVQNVYDQTISQAPILDGESAQETKMRKMYWLNLRWFMLTLLNRKDRMSMANSLEVRVPFADHRLVQYAFNIPWSMKYLGNREKGLLRTALKGLLPREILERRKSPWPKTHDPVYLELVKQKLELILADSQSPLGQLVDLDTVRYMLKPGGSKLETPWFGQLMTGPQLLAWLVQIDLWLRAYNIKIEI